MNLNELYETAYFANENGMLLQGDCVEMMKLMPDECVDLTVTSPPYDDLRNYKEGFSFDFESVAKELFRITKLGGGSCVGSWGRNQRWFRNLNFI